MARITAGWPSAAASSIRSQRSDGDKPPCVASCVNDGSQASGSDLPLLRHKACASCVHRSS